MLPIGIQFDCFEEEATCKLIKKLGCGAFGCVYKVEVSFKDFDYDDLINLEDYYDRMLLQRENVLLNHFNNKEKGEKIYLAVKISQKNSKYAIESNLVEAVTWGNLPAHPNVIDLIHSEIISCNLLLFTELVEGNDPSDMDPKFHLKSKQQSLAELLKLSLGLVQGLMHIHENHLHHFDIKPANLMITNNFDTKVCDFGLAELEKPDSVKGATGDNLSKGYAKRIRGMTRLYMMPEYDIGGQMTCLGGNQHDKKLYCCSCVDGYAAALTILDLWRQFSSNHTAAFYSTKEDNRKIAYLFNEAIVTRVTRKGFPPMPLSIQTALISLLSDNASERPCNLWGIEKALIDETAKLTGRKVEPYKSANSLDFSQRKILQGSSLLKMALRPDIDSGTRTNLLSEAERDFIMAIEDLSPDKIAENIAVVIFSKEKVGIINTIFANETTIEAKKFNYYQTAANYFTDAVMDSKNNNIKEGIPSTERIGTNAPDFFAMVLEDYSKLGNPDIKLIEKLKSTLSSDALSGMEMYNLCRNKLESPPTEGCASSFIEDYVAILNGQARLGNTIPFGTKVRLLNSNNQPVFNENSIATIVNYDKQSQKYKIVNAKLGADWASSSDFAVYNGECVDNGQGQCTFPVLNCPPGKYKNGAHCTKCPRHTYSSTENALTCEKCPAGSDTPDIGYSSCSHCPANTYRPEEGFEEGVFSPGFGLHCLDCSSISPAHVASPGSAKCTWSFIQAIYNFVAMIIMLTVLFGFCACCVGVCCSNR